MTSERTDRTQPTAKADWFTTTHWSLILRTRDPSSTLAAEALEKLCRTYWYPLYAFVRRQGKNEDNAKDLTQAYFARLLEKSVLDQVDREKGKFRSFLLKSMKNFLADEWDKAQAQKRGGGKQFISLDDANAEERYLQEPTDEMSPDRLFDRRWAMTVLEEAQKRLRKEYAMEGREELYDQLRVFLAGGPGTPTYAQMAERLKTTAGTLKSWVHRYRQRNRELVREVIANTVASIEQIDEELRQLFAALAAE